MARPGVVLLGATGQGNHSLRALLRMPGVDLRAVFAPPRPAGPFPYHPCPQLAEEAARAGLPVFEGLDMNAPEGLDIIRALRPELVVCSTFNRILRRDLLAVPGRGVVNIHPSLLPRHRGAIPTVAAILAGDAATGVTAHWIVDQGVDNGPIIARRETSIGPDETDGELRARLSALSEEVLAEVVSLALADESPHPAPQDESLATACPARTEELRRIHPSMSAEAALRTFRAMHPWPGALVDIDGVDHRVLTMRRADPGETPDPDEAARDCADGSILVRAVALRKAAFLDRDGVIIVDTGHPHRPEDVRWVPGAPEAVRLLNERGYVVVVVTNQAGIAKGYYTEQEFLDFMDGITARLAQRGARVDAFRHCPHHPIEGIAGLRVRCNCRKPAPGMLLDALHGLNLDRASSFLIGDRDSDIQAARAAGITGHLFTGGNLHQFITQILHS